MPQARDGGGRPGKAPVRVRPAKPPPKPNPVIGKNLGSFPVPKAAIRSVRVKAPKSNVNQTKPGSKANPSKLAGYALDNNGRGYPVPARAVKSTSGATRVAGKKLGPYPVPKSALKKANPRVASDPTPSTKLNRAGTLPDNIGARPNALGRGASAPILKVLDLADRPLHAVAGAMRAGVPDKSGKTGNAANEAWKGLAGKAHYGTADVLTKAGVGHKAAAVAGQFGDVVANPTNYIGFGGASAAVHAVDTAAATAAKKATEKALKAGLTEEQAARFGERAAKQATEAGRGKSGGVVSIRLGTVNAKKVKAQVNIPVRTTLTGRGSRVTASVRRAVHEVRPTVRRSATTDRLEHRTVLHVNRQRRAVNQNAMDEAAATGRDLARRIPKDQHAAVIDAIERRKIGSLPGDLRPVARELRDHFRYHARLRRQAGKQQGHIVNYFPHRRAADLEAAPKPLSDAQKLEQEQARPGSSIPSTKKRQIQEPISTANGKVHPGNEFSTDTTKVVPHYQMQTARIQDTALAAEGARNAGRRVLRPGPLRPGRVHVADHEVVVHVGREPRVLDPAERKAFVEGGPGADRLPQGGQYRIMSAETAKALTDKTIHRANAFTRRVVHPWKGVATATPAFQVRNAAGDAERAISASVPAARLPQLLKDAGQTIRYLHQNQATFGRPTADALVRRKMKDKAVVDLGKSGQVTMRQFAAEVKRNGLVRSGVRGSDLAAAGEGIGQGGRIRSAANKAGQVLRDRENVTYVATYKHFRMQGLSEEAATRRTMDALIDYGELTNTERVLRNTAVPFYTFQSRVVPFYAKTLVQRPGKIANYENLRENTARFFGANPDSINAEGDYKQRQAPIFGPGGKFISDGLPMVQGLNELPTTTNVNQYRKELTRYAIGSLAPWVKIPMEALSIDYGGPGINYFFEAPIENPYHRLVTAPVVPGVPWRDIPKGVRDKLGVTQIKDARTGKVTWGWRGWKQYLLSQATPGAPGFALRIGESTTQRGQNREQQIIGFLTGVKVDNPDPIGAAINRGYAQLDLITKMKSDLAQHPGGKATRAYQKLTRQAANLNATIGRLQRERGDLNAKKNGTGGGGGGISIGGAGGSDIKIGAGAGNGISIGG